MIRASDMERSYQVSSLQAYEADHTRGKERGDYDSWYSAFLAPLLPGTAADLLRSAACLLPDTARKMVARLETTLIGYGAYGQSCLFEHLDPFCYSLLPEIRDRSQRQMLLKEADQMKGTHRRGLRNLLERDRLLKMRQDKLLRLYKQSGWRAD